MKKFKTGGVLAEADKTVNKFFAAIDAICDDYEQRQTQKKQILDYLKTGKSITKLEALKMFGCWNSGDCIFNLRKEGYNIKTTMITNGKKRFASYKLIENGN